MVMYDDKPQMDVEWNGPPWKRKCGWLGNMGEGVEVWDGVEGWVNVDGWCIVFVGGSVKTWGIAREGVDGWGGGSERRL